MLYINISGTVMLVTKSILKTPTTMNDPAHALAYAVMALQQNHINRNNPILQQLTNSMLMLGGGQLNTLSMLRAASISKEQLEQAKQSAFKPAVLPSESIPISTGTVVSSSESVSNHDGDMDDNDDDAEQRLFRNRERNREHARRTRLRKKAQIVKLQAKVKELNNERQVLKRQIEECSIASILLGIGTSSYDEEASNSLEPSTVGTDMEDDKSMKAALLADGSKRCRRKLLDAVIHARNASKSGDDGGAGSKSHINWKTGIFHEASGSKTQLSNEELETLR